ncbi:uncharacterized protein LOC143018574 [Oratosquilla oratoria]|uniref:uncharacterized protein LOC143018574 n=1 Tax=Oratosquilla oratoria TaxID=337810 RepID=UPI003F761228
MRATLFTVTLGLFLCSSATVIGHETVMNIGCTANTVMVFEELRWRHLYYMNSTHIYIEVDNIEPGDTSIQCPGPCGAQKNTPYKVGFHPTIRESNEIKISFVPYEDKEEESTAMMEKEPILCTCDIESGLVFQGAATLITCKEEESEVKNVLKDWRSQLPKSQNNPTNMKFIIFPLVAVFIVLFIVCGLYESIKYGTSKDQRPSEERGLGKIFKKNVLSNIHVCRRNQKNDDTDELCEI